MARRAKENRWCTSLTTGVPKSEIDIYFPRCLPTLVLATFMSIALAGCANEATDAEDTDSQTSAYSHNQVTSDSSGLNRRLHVNISRLPKVGTQSYAAYWLDIDPAGGFRFEQTSNSPVTQVGTRFSSSNGFSLQLPALVRVAVGEVVVTSSASLLPRAWSATPLTRALPSCRLPLMESSCLLDCS